MFVRKTWIIVPVSTLLPQGQRVIVSSHTRSSGAAEGYPLLDPDLEAFCLDNSFPEFRSFL